MYNKTIYDIVDKNFHQYYFLSLHLCSYIMVGARENINSNGRLRYKDISDKSGR